VAFTLIRELLEIPRDQGNKRLLIALYSTDSNHRYVATSEQVLGSEGEWLSNKKGMTIRRGELDAVIKALQSADFDAAPDTSNLSCQEYASTLDWSKAQPGVDYNPDENEVFEKIRAARLAAGKQ
jgi:hypothetical protein